MLIGVDFDHTIVDNDKPLPGAKAALQKLREDGHKILIHSCNNYDWILKVLNNHEIPYDYIWDSGHDIGKPVCDCYIDDRAIGFRGDWKQTIVEVEKIGQARRKVMGFLRETDTSTEAGKE